MENILKEKPQMPTNQTQAHRQALISSESSSSWDTCTYVDVKGFHS